MLQGKIIGITGTIELYQGKPEIKVTSMVQIKGADSQLAAIKLDLTGGGVLADLQLALTAASFRPGVR